MKKNKKDLLKTDPAKYIEEQIFEAEVQRKMKKYKNYTKVQLEQEWLKFTGEY